MLAAFRPSRTALFTVAAAALGIGVFNSAAAQPPHRWLAHDMRRPRPPVVSPGKPQLPAAIPADARVLFDGSDLSEWRDDQGQPARWIVKDGYMESVPNSGYVYTADGFGDVQLHIEWASPTPAKGRSQGRGNSGVFLMGLYEIQVLDSYENETYADGQAGAIYGQYPPLVNACLPPGEWQDFDIVFRRPRFDDAGAVTSPARVTAWHNGLLIQDAVELWGPTAWLQFLPYKKHADRLPLSLQDHGNPVRYRNIWVRELPEDPPADPPAARDDGSASSAAPSASPSGQPNTDSTAAAQPAGAADAAVTLTPEQQQQIAGRYGSPLGDFGEIVLEGDRLWLRMETGQNMELVPLSADSLALRWTAGRLELKRKPSGEVAGFTLHLAGERYPIGRKASGK